ncbi:MAG: acetylxylan esterase [Clostridia bacterium]|nr:acetylxylan esterase [Clostridia bacterium]
MSDLIQTPALLWDNFDTPAADFHAERVNNVTDTKTETVSFFIDGRTDDNAVCRVYIKTVMPSRTEYMPSVLLIGEIDKHIDEEKLQYFARNGYAAFGVDFTGEGEMCTVYPQSLEYCKASAAVGFLNKAEGDVKNTIWYNYAYNARRALSFIAGLPFVNNDKIYVCSIKSADKIGMIVTAMDKRVKAFASLYGDCWEAEDLVNVNAAAEENIEAALKKQEELQRYIAGISPQAYLTNVSVPYLSVIGSNSITIDVSRLNEGIKRMNNNGKSTLIVAPNLMDASNGNGLYYAKQFFDNPDKEAKDIRISFEKVEKKLCIRAEADFEGDLRVFYARGEAEPPLKNWVEAVSRGDNLFSLDTTGDEQTVVAFCAASDKDGDYCSDLVSVQVADFGELNAVLQTSVLYSAEKKTAPFVPLSPLEEQSEEFIARNPVNIAEVNGIKGICGKAVSTYVLNDPIIRPSKQGILLFDCFSKVEQTVTVYIATEWGSRPVLYCAECRMVGGDEWQKIVLTKEDFKTASNKTLGGFSDARVLSFVADRAFVLCNMLLY